MSKGHTMRLSGTSLFLVAIALIFLGIGGWVGVLQPRELLMRAAQVEQLPLIGASSLADRPIGATVAIEGSISPRNTALFRDYAAYYREEYRGDDDDGDPIWREDQRNTPAIRLGVADGTIQITNDNYQLQMPLSIWSESERLSWNVFSGEGTKRYYGVLLNDAVFAVGSVVPGNEGPELQAEYIVQGSRTAYIAHLQSEASSSRWLGIAFGGVSALLLIIAVVAWVRAW